MNEHRTKTYLTRYVKSFFNVFGPSQLGFTDDFKVEVRHEGGSWIQISIQDPTENAPRYFEVRVTEKT